MPAALHLLDVVALLSDMPAHGLVRGQVGVVVEFLPNLLNRNADLSGEMALRIEKGST